MKKIIPIILACGAMSLASCESNLDVEPKDRLTEGDYFKTATDLEMFTNPLYNNILPKGDYDEQSDVLIQKTLSDLMLGGARRSIPTSGGGWSWGDLRRINTLLGNVDKCEDKAAVAKYSAVARFFRAYFYYEKVKRFGDVPWYTTELGSSDPALYKARDSRELVMSNMIKDIDYAIENLPSKASEANPTFRLTKGAALALKARFCLFEGTYRKYHGINYEDGNNADFYLEQAADAAKTLMDRGEYKLYSTGKPAEDYQNLFVQEVADRNEYILAISFMAATGSVHNATGFVMTATQGRPGYTRKFVCSYLMKDGSRFTDKNGWQTMSFLEEMVNRDPRLTQTMRGLGYHRIGKTQILPADFELSVTGYVPVKYVQNPDDNGKNVDRPDRSTCDLPVFRYAEVLLNYAEAKAELGTLTQADLDLSVNLIRDRAGMPHMNLADANANPDSYMSSEKTGFSNVTGANAGVILEIRRERSIELVQEGFRLDDLFRWKAGKCLDQDLLGMYLKGPGSYDLSGDGKTDMILYANGTAKPSAAAGVNVYELDKDIFLTDGSHGYYDYHTGVKSVRAGFNEERDYLYPIPSNEFGLNKNLVQNPGWK